METTTPKVKRSKRNRLVKAIKNQTRITAEELFSLFTADIINKKSVFTR